MRLCCLLILALSLVTVESLKNTDSPTIKLIKPDFGRPRLIEHVEGFQIIDTATGQPVYDEDAQLLLGSQERTNEHGHRQPFGEHLKVQFRVFDQDYSFTAKLQHGHVHPETKFHFYNAKNELMHSETPLAVFYHGHEMSDPSIRAALTIKPDGHVRLLVSHVNTGAEADANALRYFTRVLTIEPLALAKDRKWSNPEAKADVEAAMHPFWQLVAFYDDATINGDVSSSVPSSSSEPNTIRISPLAKKLLASGDPGQPLPGRPVQSFTTVPKFNDCWYNPKGGAARSLYLGVAADAAYHNAIVNARERRGQHGKEGAFEDVAFEIVDLLSKTNFILAQQLNILIVMKQSFVITEEGGDIPWNDNLSSTCEVTDIQEKLNHFLVWRIKNKDIHNAAGLWHLLSGCENLDAAGVAFVNEVCYPRGVALTSIYDDTWVTFAHETGHSLGADHSFEEGESTTGGIMDYGDGRLHGMFQFNEKYRKVQVCQRLSASMRSMDAYRRPPGTSQVCWGNYREIFANTPLEKLIRTPTKMTYAHVQDFCWTKNLDVLHVRSDLDLKTANSVCKGSDNNTAGCFVGLTKTPRDNRIYWSDDGSPFDTTKVSWIDPVNKNLVSASGQGVILNSKGLLQEAKGTKATMEYFGLCGSVRGGNIDEEGWDQTIWG